MLYCKGREEKKRNALLLHKTYVGSTAHRDIGTFHLKKENRSSKSTYHDEVENRRDNFWRDLVSVLERESAHVEYDHTAEYLSSRF